MLRTIDECLRLRSTGFSLGGLQRYTLLQWIFSRIKQHQRSRGILPRRADPWWRAPGEMVNATYPKAMFIHGMSLVATKTHHPDDQSCEPTQRCDFKEGAAESFYVATAGIAIAATEGRERGRRRMCTRQEGGVADDPGFKKGSRANSPPVTGCGARIMRCMTKLALRWRAGEQICRKQPQVWRAMRMKVWWPAGIGIMEDRRSCTGYWLRHSTEFLEFPMSPRKVN